MALIYCRECGQQISEHAPSCPNCGAPHPQNKRKNNLGIFMVIIFIAIIGIGGYLYFTSPNTNPPTSETRKDRVDAADRLLSKDCQALTDMSTEYIKNDVAAAFISALGNSKCDCIREKLREKLADKYTLPQLQAFEKKPLHEIQEIKDLIEENNEELQNCFPLINKIKDAVNNK